MAYNDDSVLARLSSLNESHDSIATAAQWIMFHRYASFICQFVSTINNRLQAARRANRTTLDATSQRLVKHKTIEFGISREWYVCVLAVGGLAD